jgi:hypothetical protein
LHCSRMQQNAIVALGYIICWRSHFKVSVSYFGQKLDMHDLLGLL